MRLASLVVVTACVLGTAEVARADELAPTSYVEVAERETPIGWVYDYRVVNSDKRDIIRITLGDSEDSKHALVDPPLTVVSPRLWDSAVTWADTDDLFLLPVEWTTRDEERFLAPVRPGEVLEGFAVVYPKRCGQCLEAAFELTFEITSENPGREPVRGQARPSQRPFSTTEPVLVKVPDDYGEEKLMTGPVPLRAVVSDPARVVALHFESEEQVISDNLVAPWAFTWDSRTAKWDAYNSVDAVATMTDGRVSRSYGTGVNLKNGNPEPMCSH